MDLAVHSAERLIRQGRAKDRTPANSWNPTMVTDITHSRFFRDSTPPSASMYQEKYHGTFRGLSPRMESMVTDRIRGEIKDSSSSRINRPNPPSISSLCPAVQSQRVCRFFVFEFKGISFLLPPPESLPALAGVWAQTLPNYKKSPQVPTCGDETVGDFPRRNSARAQVIPGIRAARSSCTAQKGRTSPCGRMLPMPSDECGRAVRTS